MVCNYRTCLVGVLVLLSTSAASAHGFISDHRHQALTESPVFLLTLFIAFCIALSVNRFLNRTKAKRILSIYWGLNFLARQ